MTTDPAEQHIHENPYRAEPMINQRDQKPLRDEDRLSWKRVARGMRWMLIGSIAFVISSFGGLILLGVVVSSSVTNYEEDALYGVIEFLTLFLSYGSTLMVCLGIALCLYTPKQVNARWFIGRSLVIAMTFWSVLFSDWVGGRMDHFTAWSTSELTCHHASCDLRADFFYSALLGFSFFDPLPLRNRSLSKAETFALFST